MKHILSILVISILGCSNIYANENKENETPPGQYNGELIVNVDIKKSQEILNISNELKKEIADSIKKEYIIFYENLWGKLPKAEDKAKRHRIKEDNDSAEVFIGNIFDDDYLALLSKIQNNNKASSIDDTDTIRESISYGILPLFFENGVTQTEIDNLEIIDLSLIKNSLNIYKSTIRVRGILIESHHIVDKESLAHAKRVFSISREIKEEWRYKLHFHLHFL